MKIGLIGNCQVRGLRECLEILAPKDSFEAIQVEQLLADDLSTLSRISELSATVDVLFTHEMNYAVTQEKSQLALRDTLRSITPNKVVIIPSILFSGFHPDCCMIFHNEAYLQNTATYTYHSAIVAGAYLCGMPAKRVPALFNRFVYAGLGYQSHFEYCRQNLLERFAQLGFDAEPILASRDAFMHSPNHPVVAAMFELAKQMLRRVGIPFQQSPPPEDWMLKYTLLWPVYPGLPGGHSPDAHANDCSLIFTHGPRQISLLEVITSSYSCYAENGINSSNIVAPAVTLAVHFFEQHTLR